MRSVTGGPAHAGQVRDDGADRDGDGGLPGARPPATWRVWVTERDLRDARDAWVRARDGGAPPDRVRDLLDELERLIRTSTFQAQGDPWATGTVPSRKSAVPSLIGRRSLRPPARLSPTG